MNRSNLNAAKKYYYDKKKQRPEKSFRPLF